MHRVATILFYWFLAVAYPLGCFANDTSTEIDYDALAKMINKETKLNLAAVDVFWGLREKFGKELLLTGGLLYCGKKELAFGVHPKIYDLFIEAIKITDGLDYTQYGLEEMTDGIRRELSRRAVTAATVYIYSAEEPATIYENMTPEFRNAYCTSVMKVYEELKAP